MLKYAVLISLAVVVSVADHHEGHPKITCDNAVPLKDINFYRMTGYWVTVETLGFKDGHPYTPVNDTRPNMCGYAKAREAHENGLTVSLYFEEPGKDLYREVIQPIVIDPAIKGRMSFTSDSRDATNWEYVLIDHDPKKYLALLLCLPPNADGERLPFQAMLYSRFTDHEVTTLDEEHQIETHMREMLRLNETPNKPVRYSPNCWAAASM